ncbi:hypothetical protein L249_1458 [Ophiocordyceps polyrhachis-furcata BCC 54312]|uniref:Uncharacterized protein n=1 Tax=Ophiocordyceps polyrhachis-furcata BCC 54312 TaxID=1330021 RepID=A0A367L4E0_9HYPO|nr:hypothetical protein L249_1458 [Ophiocordyceps polyrhachis-furcata BCC 54312]
MLSKFFTKPVLSVSVVVVAVFAFISSVLTAVTLAAGARPNSNEELAILKVDMSRFNGARGLLPSSESGGGGGGGGGDLVDTIVKGGAKGIEGILTSLTGSSSTKASSRLVRRAPRSRGSRTTGSRDSSRDNPRDDSSRDDSRDKLSATRPVMPQYISLHVQTMCNGDFGGNIGASSQVRIKSCTAPGRPLKDVSEVVGLSNPLPGLTSRLLPTVVKETMQLSVDMLNSIQVLLTVVFAIGTASSFLSLLFIVISFFFQRMKILIYTNFILAAIAAAFVSGAFIGADLFFAYVAKRTNRVFKDFNIHAELGSTFLGVSIAAAFFSISVFIYWLIRVVLLFRESIFSKMPAISKLKGLIKRKKVTDAEPGATNAHVEGEKPAGEASAPGGFF